MVLRHTTMLLRCATIGNILENRDIPAIGVSTMLCYVLKHNATMYRGEAANPLGAYNGPQFTIKSK